MFLFRSRLTRVLLIAFGLLCPTFLGTAQAQTQQPALQEIKARGEIRVGWAVFYPYIYRDMKTNELNGFAADFMKAMADALQVKLVWVEDSWATLTAGLQTKKYDLTIPGVAITLARAEVVTFSKPVAKMPLGLMVMKKEGLAGKTWEDFDKPGKKITTTLGSVVDLFATKRFKNAEIIRVKAGPDSIAQLVSGKADAWANGVEGLTMVSKDRPEFEIVSGTFGSNPICLMVRQGDVITRDYVDLFIDDLRRSGVLRDLVQKHGLFEWDSKD